MAKNKKAVKKEAKIEEIKLRLKKPSKAAFILVLISSILLFLQGILHTSLLFFRNSIILELERQAIEIPADIQATITTWGFFGVAWIIVSILIFLSNFKIKKTADKSWMWFLFTLSLLVLLSGAGMYITGILALVGSVMYLAEKGKA